MKTSNGRGAKSMDDTNNRGAMENEPTVLTSLNIPISVKQRLKRYSVEKGVPMSRIVTELIQDNIEE